ncbi:ankyrin repeat domain-containing protein 40-like [Saccostrea echinata]|uniref:ankyrin repeat domain-containing protein 40-like n=1 Tax=Saccostrea echinata TaxID=191078 RepID=UPI002A7F9978|nr:ankyrin repeat domain-containing protein 40-like [Saccostrea echinata]
MDNSTDSEEQLREAACIGDLESVKALIESSGVDINSQNKVNGWTSLHWAAKRNHSGIVSYLLLHGADKYIKTNNGEIASQLSTFSDIKNMLGGTNAEVVQKDLPITPNYLANPPFPYTQPVVQKSTDSSRENPGRLQEQNCASNNELVIKVRVANSEERDFIEVELDKHCLSFDRLLAVCCQELGVQKGLVFKIRKLPNTIVRKDKDVGRLTDFQELEIVLKNNSEPRPMQYGVSMSQRILY